MADKEETKKNKREEKQKQAASNGASQEILLTPEQFDEIKVKIDEITQQRDDYLQTAQRLQAEFDNYRKRTAATRSESLEEGSRETVKELLPLLDSLERARDGARQDDPYAQGVLQICKQAFDILAKLGLEEIDAGGEFDPMLHDALMQVEVQGAEPGSIAEVLQRGYIFKGKTIRCAAVKVAK